MSEPKNVYQCIAAVSAELAKDGIAKDRANTQQNYRFRGIDDVMNALAPIMAKTGLVILPRCLSRDIVERPSRSGGVLFCVTLAAEFDFVSSHDGSRHTVTMYGEAMDSADKATNKAMSAAYKYACLQTFCIPTEGDHDADAHSPEVAPPAAQDAAALPPQAKDRENQAAATGETRGLPAPIGVRITKVDETTIKSTGKPKWYVHFEDGNKASTIVGKVAQQAEHCCRHQIRVQPELEKTQWGYNLMRLFEVQAPVAAAALPEIQLRGDEHRGPVNEDDIPF